MFNKAVNNEMSVTGEITSGFTFSHEVFGKGFYKVDVAVNRLSEQVDLLPLMISDSLIDVHKDYTGYTVECTGQFRSYNRCEGIRNRLELSIFVRDIHITLPTDPTKNNQIFLDGYICRPPIYRKTPLGKEITNILLAVNRPHGKSDYIPCICWESKARRASGFEVGTRLKIWGRVQSREYIKKLSETETEIRTAYEVSVLKLKGGEGNEM